MKFRKLKENEIECRVGTVKKESGFSLLLYKDARCDMRILDETVGSENWKREHLVKGTPIWVEYTVLDKYGKEKIVREIKGQYFSCVVSIWDKEKKMWIEKEDTGTESNTEETKGLYSDSFKRACFNWGIGRELYTSPFIWIKNSDGTPFDGYSVQKITYDDEGSIDGLAIINNKTKKRVFCQMPKSKK